MMPDSNRQQVYRRPRNNPMFSFFVLLLSLLFIASPARAVNDQGEAGVSEWSYRQAGKRDPFQVPPDLVAATESSDSEGSAKGKRPKREKKEYLESFQLDSLKLVATVFQIEGQSPVAMVEDPMGVGHVVKAGQYLGVNEGLIKEIHDGVVVIEEQVPDKNSPQPTRTITLKLPKEVK